jgi:hypothetical protein
MQTEHYMANMDGSGARRFRMVGVEHVDDPADRGAQLIDAAVDGAQLHPAGPSADLGARRRWGTRRTAALTARA